MDVKREEVDTVKKAIKDRKKAEKEAKKKAKQKDKPKSKQCTASTSDDKRCKIKTTNASGKCYYHD